MFLYFIISSLPSESNFVYLSDFKNNRTVSVDGESIGILTAFFRIFHKVLKIKI
jgi:hypothetical protein